jgi:L-ascorbate metabolism protein UlaG (beta-lactamase superfamily)
MTFVGTATTVLPLGSFTLLTDPNFVRRGQRVHLGCRVSSRRRTDPARTIAELPRLDAVLLSHLHGDHSDRVARRGLPRDPRCSPRGRRHTACAPGASTPPDWTCGRNKSSRTASTGSG